MLESFIGELSRQAILEGWSLGHPCPWESLSIDSLPSPLLKWQLAATENRVTYSIRQPNTLHINKMVQYPFLQTHIGRPYFVL